MVGGRPRRLMRLSKGASLFLQTAGLVGGASPDHGLGPIRAVAPAQDGLCRRLEIAGFLVAASRPHRPRPTTVVIPCRDDQQGAQRTVESVAQWMSSGAVAEVLIVDDGSARPVDITAPPGLTVRIVRGARSRGPGAARNRGLREARTPWVAFVDCGVEVTDDGLAALGDRLQATAAAFVAPRVVTSSMGSQAAVWERFDAASSPLDMGNHGGFVGPELGVRYVPSTCLLVDAAKFRAVGGFDEGLRFGEDVDVVWRLAVGGEPGYFDPSVVVTHPARTRRRDWMRQRFDYGTSAAQLEQRHQGRVRPLVISASSAATVAALGMRRWSLAAAVVAVTSAITARRVAAMGEHREPALYRVGAVMGLRGHAASAIGAANAAVRPGWPVLLLAGALSRRARPLACAAVAVHLADSRRRGLAERRSAGVDPFTWASLRLLDDGAYSLGVWAGAWRNRRPDVLLPTRPSTPGGPLRRTAAPSGWRRVVAAKMRRPNTGMGPTA